MATTTEYKYTLHYTNQEKADATEQCHHLYMQTRPLNFKSPHTKRLSKLILKGLFKTYNSDLAAFLVFGSNLLDTWELVTYQQASSGLDIFNTRIIGNYKFYIVVFACGKDTLVQQIDAVESERFTQTFR